AIDALPFEESQDVLKLRHRFGPLAHGDDMNRSLQARALDGFRHLDRPRPDVGVGDDRDASRIEPGDDAAQLAMDVAADDDGVAARGRVENQADQSLITSSATTSTGRSPSTRCAACS